MSDAVDLATLDSVTLREMLAANQEAERKAQEANAARLSAVHELDDIEREVERVRRVLYEAAVPHCDRCDGPCHHGYEGASVALMTAAHHRVDFTRYRELVLLSNTPPTAGPVADAGAQAFAIKRELVRRGEWP